MTKGEDREREWLAQEVALSANLTDADRIRILRDLLRTADAIRRTKSADDLQREEEVRRTLEELPARQRYLALWEKLR
jgi:hypothetical protein